MVCLAEGNVLRVLTQKKNCRLTHLRYMYSTWISHSYGLYSVAPSRSQRLQSCVPMYHTFIPYYEI